MYLQGFCQPRFLSSLYIRFLRFRARARQPDFDHTSVQVFLNHSVHYQETGLINTHPVSQSASKPQASIFQQLKDRSCFRLRRTFSNLKILPANRKISYINAPLIGVCVNIPYGGLLFVGANFHRSKWTVVHILRG